MIFVGNKIDQRQEQEQYNKDPKTAPIKTETARKFIEESFKGCKYLECSALTQEGLKGVFD
jgi:GTPase SAR1 family protein